jgi:hypothetical protein
MACSGMNFHFTRLVADRYSTSGKSRDCFCAAPGAVPIQQVPGALFTGVKWSECEADSTLLYSTVVRMRGTVNTPTIRLPDTYLAN